jgi:hypothetical protein
MVMRMIVSFLPEGTRLLYFVNPSGEYDKKLFSDVSTSLDENQSMDKCYIPIDLEEEQKICFSISKNNNLSRDLEKCRCSSPALPEKSLKSINGACQSISTVFEKERASKGRKVYDIVYFQDTDKKWKLLDILRERIFSEYKLEFNRQQISEGFGVSSYLRLHPDSIEHFTKLLGDKDNLIHDLKIQQSDLEIKINYFNNLFQSMKISVYQKSLEDFEKRLKEDHYETKGNDSWQSWIYNNRWLFGTQYGQIIQKEKIGFDNIPDFLLLTAEGFLDVLEIKKPSSPVLLGDSSHQGNFKWSSEVSEALAQADNYLNHTNLHHLEISKRIKEKYDLEINAIKPRAIVLIGRSDTWNNNKRERFRSLNQMLHGVEVVTYSDLQRRGQSLIKLYTE